MEQDWQKVEQFIESVTGKLPADIKGYLFLIGVQVLGKGALHFSKEQKQDLIHIAICEIFSLKGYYKFSHKDEDGWPHYELINKVPHQKLFEQEHTIKEQIIAYFYSENLIN